LVTQVRLPKLGKTMQQALVVEYKVGLGDRVKKGDIIFEIETDKATIEVESPADGFVKHIFAPLGRTLQVGQPVLLLADKDEKVPQELIESLSTEQAQLSPVAEEDRPQEMPLISVTENKGRVPPAPVSTGQELGLGQVIALTDKQRITAQKMVQSKRQIPCFYLNVRADVTELVELRAEMNKTAEIKISYNDFLMQALARALVKFPIMTGQLAGDHIRLAERINIALAMTVPDGLVNPVVRDVDKKTIAQIARDRQDLAEKARNNKLKPADLEGACITISNLGPYGVESFIPIVVPGQCSIIGLGKITQTCKPNDMSQTGAAEPEITIRKLMSLTLSVDHRIANGTYAAQFLDFVRKLLEDPSCFS